MVVMSLVMAAPRGALQGADPLVTTLRENNGKATLSVRPIASLLPLSSQQQRRNRGLVHTPLQICRPACESISCGTGPVLTSKHC